ncbi:MAG: PstS family phosphate ABC transporter substrate-binding protein [Dehalococcoidia bacterium]
MIARWRTRSLVAGIVVSAAMLATACGGGDGGATSGDGATKHQEPANKAELAKLKGDIVIDGSSTVYPVTQAAAEEFAAYARDVRISVGIAGTGGGFKKFCAGETDIQDASRPISTSEAAACADKKIEFVELPVAYDGLAVVVSPKNTWAQCMTVAELKKIWEPAAQGKVTNWKQVRDSFPDRPLKLFGPGTDSGTFDYFTEAVNGKAKDSRGDYQASEDDNVLVQGVSTDESALGYFGLAYFTENAAKLKLVHIDSKGDGKCIEPSIKTVSDGSYQPLSRPLFIYVRKSVAERPEVKAYVNFYLSKSFTPAIETREVGYVALSDKLYEASTKRFAAGASGTLFPKGAEVGATLDRYLQ